MSWISPYSWLKCIFSALFRFKESIFVEMSLPNDLNFTMEIKCSLLTLVRNVLTSKKYLLGTKSMD